MGRALGQDKSLIDRRLPFRVYRRLAGSEDMHSHYRWRAVEPLIDLEAPQTLEVGGGDGRIGFEVVRSGHRGLMWVTEFDPRTLREAELTAELGGFDNVRVSQQDLMELREQGPFDQVLAIDVLEHIEDDELAIKLIAGVLRPGGRLVISVPTPRYPHVFGRRFHEHLGHVREGYLLAELRRKLAAAGFTVVEHRYYTGRWVSRACRLFYAWRVPYVLGVLWAPLVRPLLQRTEGTVHEDEAASLALVAELSDRAA
jgi:SAM-dependent methyltransferase